MNRLLAIGLVTIGMLGAACTGGSPQPREAPPPAGVIAPSYRETGERARGPAARHAHHHHAEHARVP